MVLIGKIYSNEGPIMEHQFQKNLESCLNFLRTSRRRIKVSVKENEVPTEKNASRASIFATKASYISN